MKRTLGVFFLMMLAGLPVLVARTLSADTYAVRSADPENLELDWPKVLADVPEKYCFKVHCIVPADTAVVADTLFALKKKQAVSLELLPDARKLFFQNGTWDADKGAFENVFPGMDEVDKGGPNALVVIVFRSYPQKEWLDALEAAGFTPIDSIPTMGYLIYGPRSGLPLLKKGHPEVDSIVDVPAGIKRFGIDTLEPSDTGGELETTMIVASPGRDAIESILQTRNGRSPDPIARGRKSLTYGSKLTLSEAQLLSQRQDVLAVRRLSSPAKPSDERSNALIAGSFRGWPNPSWPTGALPGNTSAPHYWDSYVSSLTTTFPRINGVLGTEFDPAHQLIGFLDTGIDDGLFDASTGAWTCPYFLLAPDGSCRLVFTADLTVNWNTSSLRADDYSNHGSSVASIAAGFGSDTIERRDTAGYSFTQGACPGARIAIAKIFATCTVDSNNGQVGYRILDNLPFDDFNFIRRLRYGLLALGSTTQVSAEPELSPGARLFNHSWNVPSTYYEDTAQLVDRSTRSLQAVQFGGVTPSQGPANTPSLHVIAAGNYKTTDALYIGNPTRPVTAPANAKNAITVGATHTFNDLSYGAGPGLECDLYNTAAANGFDNNGIVKALHIANFSAIGFSNQRLKPDLVAPGARAYGPTSFRFFRSPTWGQPCPEGCSEDVTADGMENKFTWTWGTSFSTPVVTGAAALTNEWLRWSLQNSGQQPVDPSPALVKATLIASAKSLTNCNPGCGCTDALSMPVGPGIDAWVRPAPDRFQGWGGVSLDRLFGTADRYWFGNQASDMLLRQADSGWVKILTVADPGKPTSVSLVWTDAASETNIELDQLNLKNDIDLFVYGYEPKHNLASWIWYGDYYYYTSSTSCDRNGNSVTTGLPLNVRSDRGKNNVERVTIPGGMALDRIKIVVVPFYIPSDALDPFSSVDPRHPDADPKQDFAVAVINAHQ